MKELHRLTLNGVADFYQTDAENDVSGVAAPDGFEYGYFVVSIVREPPNWKFFFKTLKGEKGALILTTPAMVAFFNADIEQGPRPERPTTVGLYKEIRLEGAVRGTGIFAKGIVPKTRYRLVLQGGGNLVFECGGLPSLEPASLRPTCWIYDLRVLCQAFSGN